MKARKAHVECVGFGDLAFGSWALGFGFGLKSFGQIFKEYILHIYIYVYILMYMGNLSIYGLLACVFVYA